MMKESSFLPNSRVFLCNWAFRSLEMKRSVFRSLSNLPPFSRIVASEASGFLGLGRHGLKYNLTQTDLKQNLKNTTRLTDKTLVSSYR